MQFSHSPEPQSNQIKTSKRSQKQIPIKQATNLSISKKTSNLGRKYRKIKQSNNIKFYCHSNLYPHLPPFISTWLIPSLFHIWISFLLLLGILILPPKKFYWPFYFILSIWFSSVNMFSCFFICLHVFPHTKSQLYVLTMNYLE